jgi:ADP-ribose pyrophosphatase YjhB (NUDIX family)
MNKPSEPVKTISVPSIGVGGVLFNSHQQVLLIKRNQAPAKGLWSLPGGRLEPGETLVACCRREFYEETSLVVNVKHIVAVVERRLEGFHYVIIDYVVQLVDENKSMPKAQSDVADAKWISLDDLSHYDVVNGLTDIILSTHACQLKGWLVGLHDVNSLSTDFILPSLT